MAAAEEKQEGAASAAPAPSGGGSKVVVALTLVNVLATLGMLAILFVSFQKEQKKASVEDIAAHDAGGHGEAKSADQGGGHGGGDGKEAAKKAAKKALNFGKMVTLEQFTVNLSTPGSAAPRFVRVNISLEVPGDDVEGEVGSKMPQVRNVIIDLFNSKRSADLATPEQRDYLKEEIRNAVNAFLVTGKIKGVFFTNFAFSG